jgi:hypothetical protein
MKRYEIVATALAAIGGVLIIFMNALGILFVIAAIVLLLVRPERTPIDRD